MSNRVKAIEVTKEYVKLFNARNLMGLAAMLDPKEVIFTRQTQPSVLGKQAIMNRTHKLFKRLDMQGQKLTMVNAIIDLPDSPTYPCMIGVLDGQKFSVCFLSVKPNGMITNIAILVNPDSVAKARATQPAELDAALKIVKEPDRKELEERAKGLRKKEIKLKRRIQKEGNTPELVVKMLRLETAKKKLKAQLSQMAS